MQKCWKIYNQIFRKDISKDEAQKIADRYKEIFKIKDDKEFQDTLFNQLKNDYGLENTNFGYTVKKLSNGEKGYFNPYGNQLLVQVVGWVFNPTITFKCKYWNKKFK